MLVLIIPRKTHPYWRMLLLAAVLFSLARHSEAMFTKRLTETAATSSPTLSRSGDENSSRSKNLGSPSELAWQAWLLSDSQTGAHSTLLRRIKPKSVFIAPPHSTLPPCADGYRADAMGRCVKSVNIDQQAHLNFLLQKLNNRYANNGNTGVFNANAKKSSGPLQLNIPLLANGADRKSVEAETGDTVKIPIIIPPVIDSIPKEANHAGEAAAAMLVESKDAATTNETGRNASVPAREHDYEHYAGSSTPRLEGAVPVAEFIDDSNDTSFSEVVDYKIPAVDPRLVLNVSSARSANASEDEDSYRDESRIASNSTDPSPMLVLLSSTAIPNSIASFGDEEELDLEVDNSTENREALGSTSNSTRNDDTDKEIIDETIPGTEAAELDLPRTVVENIEDNETALLRDSNSTEIEREGFETTQEIFYDDEAEAEAEDYADSTDIPEQESSKRTDRTVLIV